MESNGESWLMKFKLIVLIFYINNKIFKNELELESNSLKDLGDKSLDIILYR